MAGRRGTIEIPVSLRVPNVPGSRGVTASGAPRGVPALARKSWGTASCRVGASLEKAGALDSGQEARLTQPALFDVFILGGVWRGRFGPAGKDAGLARGGTAVQTPDAPGKLNPGSRRRPPRWGPQPARGKLSSSVGLPGRFQSCTSACASKARAAEPSSIWILRKTDPVGSLTTDTLPKDTSPGCLAFH